MKTSNKSSYPYKYIVSACLYGENCTHAAKSKLVSSIKKMVDNKTAIAICPELLGGLPVPRSKSEIIGGSGKDVLNNKASVKTQDGSDVTVNFLKGARKTLRIATKYGIKSAILKSLSPSCGCGTIYDGTYSGNKIIGDGVTACLLKQHGIKVKRHP